jgi:hypothetical protein
MAGKGRHHVVAGRLTVTVAAAIAFLRGRQTVYMPALCTEQDPHSMGCWGLPQVSAR